MKLLKKFVWLLASVALVACGDDDSDTPTTPAFELGIDTIAGTYDLTGYEAEVSQIVTLNSNGNEVSSIVTTHAGDVLQSVLVLSSDSTFSVSDLYTYDEVVTEDGVVTAEDQVGITWEDLGTYTLDITNQEITFVSENGLLDGVYSIDDIDEENLVLTQSSEDISEEETTTTTSTSSFTFTFER